MNADERNKPKSAVTPKESEQAGTSMRSCSYDHWM